jgi:hypothetical protein
MTPVSTAELTSIRAEAATAVCDLPCTIERWDIPSKTWKVISPTGLLAGMKEPTAGQLTNYEYMIGDLATWHIQFPYSTNVAELDRLVITEGSNTRTLSVVKYLTPRSYSALESVLATE